MGDVDVAKGLLLLQRHAAAAGQLEHGQKGRDHVLGRAGSVDQLGEAHPVAGAHHTVHGRHGQGQRQALGGHVLGLQEELLASAVQVGADHSQRSQRDALQVVGHEAQELGVGTRRARLHQSFGVLAGREGRRGVAELLVLDQARDQDLADVLGREVRELVVLVIGIGRLLALAIVRRHERGRLEVEQRGRHQHEVARDVQIKPAHAFDLGQVLVGHLGDRDRPDVHLLATHELEQEVEGAGVCLGADFVRHTIRAPS